MGRSRNEPTSQFQSPSKPKECEPEPEPEFESEPELKTTAPEATPQSYPIPFSTSMPGGMNPSKVITVSGTVLPNAESFKINLRAGNDIAFHFSPRFSEKSVVRNSLIKGSWGPQERRLTGNMPFVPGQSFMMKITCEGRCYRVAVDGQPLLIYAHRLKYLPAIDHLEVTGDIELTDVQC